MSYWESLGRQLRRPDGIHGRVVGELMEHMNREPYRLALDALDAGAADHVLELGFGSGQGLAALAEQATEGRICGLDHSPDMVARAAARNRASVAAGRMELVEGSFTALPWPDRAFDRVLLVNVVYFFGREGFEIAEIRRVLRPGGRAVAYVTDAATMARWPFAGPDTHRTFDAESLAALFEDGGLSMDGPVREAPLPLGMRGLVAMCAPAAVIAWRFA